MPGIVNITRAGVAADKAKVRCIFVHGRNQSPEEMEAAVIARLTTADVHYVLPRAGDKCWYNALAVDPLTAGTRAELGRSVADLSALMQDVAVPGQALVLAGFSQGACLALEAAFAGGRPDALLAFTGCRVGMATDARAALMAAGLPVYLTAGSADPWIPLHAFAQAGVELGQAGAVLRMDMFADRPHEVSAAEIAMLDRVLADLATGRVPVFGAGR